MNNPTFCICGGGSLGHVMAAVISTKGYEVNVLSGHPAKWDSQVIAQDLHGRTYRGRLNMVSSEAKDVIPISDIIILCLPGFLLDSEIKKIKPFLREGALVGSVVSSTGFFITALSILGCRTGLFGFQRVPFIARVREYGKLVDLLGYKKQLNIVFKNVLSPDAYRLLFEYILDTPISLLDHVLEVTLTNSNPILHPTRLLCLFEDYTDVKIYPREYLFYEEWDKKSSELLIACDNEFQSILSLLPIKKSTIPSLLEYYESVDAFTLTNKIRSIEAFKSIKAPMIAVESGYIPDFKSRYFTEDIPYGLLLIKYIAQILHVKTPHIDSVIKWSQRVMHKNYISNHLLIRNSPDIQSISCLNQTVIKNLISK